MTAPRWLDGRWLRVLAALAAGLALWHALALLGVLPFRLDPGAWNTLRFFGFEWIGGVLFAALAVGWLTALRAPGMPFLRGLALLHLAIAVLAVPGGSAWQALLPDAFVCAAIVVFVTQG